MRTTAVTPSPSRNAGRLRRCLQNAGSLPLLLLLPLLVASSPQSPESKVQIDDVPIEVDGVEGVPGIPGVPSVCLDDVTGVDIPDEIYSCQSAVWCVNVGFDSMRQSLCPQID